MAKSDTNPTPAPGDFTTETEVLVRVTPGENPHAQHTQFTVFWLDDNKPNGVAGQVSKTNLAGFIDERENNAGRTVRVIA